MKATNLRLGNKVLCNGEYITITSIDEYYINYDFKFAEIRSSISITRITRIPLTEEILLKCGFIPTNPNYPFAEIKMPYLVHKGVMLFYNNTRTEYETMDYLIGCGEMRNGKCFTVTIRWIKYLHQLQNVYFALTNEELKIEL